MRPIKEFHKLLKGKRCLICKKRADALLNNGFYCKDCYALKKLETKGINVDRSNAYRRVQK
jgi:hypothetical protein